MLTKTQEWQNLQTHFAKIKDTHLCELKQQNENRFSDFSLSACNLTLDYSNNLCDQETLSLLFNLANACDMKQKVAALFSGEVVNQSEGRPALHTALRDVTGQELLLGQENILEAVRAVWSRMREISELVRAHKYYGYSGKPIKSIINIGIGGSDLGPKMAVYALKNLVTPELKFYFVSNLDVRDLQDCLAQCDPETTLFIVSSKSFTTHETLSNLREAKVWLEQRAGKTAGLSRQLIAVTANVEKAQALGFEQAYILPFWEWVGGRFSIWSAVSLSLSIAIGMDNFMQFLRGAHNMDLHFANAPLEKNMPVILGLLGIWANNFFKYKTQAVLVYSQSLKYFPEYLQQLFMESLGKRVSNEGSLIQWETGGILWGGVGTNTQHSFHQLMLQGTEVVPTDFIFPLRVSGNKENHEEMIANCLAQSEVFCNGYQCEEDASRTILGNIPHNLLMLDEVSPFCLGALIALYEHKAYVQSIVWGINPFDQWGVQRGKLIMPTILEKIRAAEGLSEKGSAGLLALIARRINEK